MQIKGPSKVIYATKNLSDSWRKQNDMIKRLNANRLSLNIDNTNCMTLRLNGKDERCPKIHINGSSILEIMQNSWVLQSIINWTDLKICFPWKMAKVPRIIIKCRYSFESETLLNLYYALILPYISYCIIFEQVRCVFIYNGALHMSNIDQIRDYSIAHIRV